MVGVFVLMDPNCNQNHHESKKCAKQCPKNYYLTNLPNCRPNSCKIDPSLLSLETLSHNKDLKETKNLMYMCHKFIQLPKLM